MFDLTCFPRKTSDEIKCSIWAGPQRGLYIGIPKRKLHFSDDHQQIVIEIDGEDCFVDFSKFKSFWTTCPEIRVATSKSGKNLLKEFIKENELLPPRHPKNKGEKTVHLRVLEPYCKFQLFIKIMEKEVTR